MVTGQIDDEEPLDVRADGADVGGVAKVDGESEAFEGNFLKEIAVPRLGGVNSSQRGKRYPTYLKSVQWEIFMERNDTR